MPELPKSQKKWITSGHYSLMYNGDQEYLRMTFSKLRLKVKRYIKNEILFLETINPEDDERDVVNKMGEPFFIHRDRLAERPHTVYIYGLKSGSNKLKVEIHFIDNRFSFGLIFYRNNFINYSDLNAYLNEKYGFSDFNFLRDVVVDPKGNILEFHIESSNLVVVLLKKEQFKL
jgi:hypothetical protein